MKTSDFEKLIKLKRKLNLAIEKCFKAQKAYSEFKSKLEEEKITVMKQLRESRMSYEAIGRKFGLTRQRVHQILNQKNNL